MNIMLRLNGTMGAINNADFIGAVAKSLLSAEPAIRE
jgi:hypothetical protein